MIRVVDICISVVAILVLVPLYFILFVACLADTGSPIFRQRRCGRFGQVFVLYKFRTMKINSKEIPTHLVTSSSITRLGRVLRTYKLDELPQFFNVLKGDMSLVGPRPCLIGQVDLIKEREKRGCMPFRPGMTGLGQVKTVTMEHPRKLARYDAVMLKKFRVSTVLFFLLATLLGFRRLRGCCSVIRSRHIRGFEKRF